MQCDIRHERANQPRQSTYDIFTFRGPRLGTNWTTKTLLHYQAELDDTVEADILRFLPRCVGIINNELEKGRGVLVHCQAGMSEYICIQCVYYKL